MTAKPDRKAIRVLAMGSSEMVYHEGDPSLALPRLIESELRKADPFNPVEVRAHVVYQMENMPERCTALAEDFTPDIVLLWLAGSLFAEETVSFSVLHRLPRLYGLLRPAVEAARSLGGGGLEGDPSLRGLLFRGPRAIARSLLGEATLIEPEVALTATLRTLKVMSARWPLVCRLAYPFPRQAAQAEVVRRRIERYNAAVAAECARLGVICFDPRVEVEKAGAQYVMRPDGLHADAATRAILAGVAAGYLLAAIASRAGGETESS